MPTAQKTNLLNPYPYPSLKIPELSKLTNHAVTLKQTLLPLAPQQFLNFLEGSSGQGSFLPNFGPCRFIGANASSTAVA